MEQNKEAKSSEAKDMAVRQGDLPLILTNENLELEALVKRADAQTEYIKKIKLISLKVTNENDWINQDDQPYLENMGTMKIRQLWKVGISDQRIEKEEFNDEKGKFLLFVCTGKADFMGIEITDIGTCSTRDDFFGKKGGVLKDIEEVDLENCKKKAVTNFQNRILKKILGLSFTWDDLKAAGLDISKIQAVKHKRSITEEDKKLQDELKAMLNEVYAADAAKIKEWLLKATTFIGKDKQQVPGIDAIERLTGKRLEITMHKAKEALEKLNKTVQGGTNGSK
jgi:hypothetical protein